MACGAEGIIRKKWCVVVWRRANVSVGSKHYPDMQTWGVWMFWICCVKRRKWRAKRGCISCLMNDVSTVDRVWKTHDSSHCHCKKTQTSARNSVISKMVSRSHPIEVLTFVESYAWNFVPWSVSAFLSLEVPKATPAKAAQVGSIASICFDNVQFMAPNTTSQESSGKIRADLTHEWHTFWIGHS